jgi:dihydrofolate reductase
MARVLWHGTMSLDGFIAGPGGSMDVISTWDDFFIETCGSWVIPYIGDLVPASEIGALVSGRQTYEGNQMHPNCWRHFGAFKGPVFVLTHHARQDPSVTFLSGDISAAVATAARAAGDRYVVILGADIARQCIDARLIDEVLIHVVPVLLGEGVRLFTRPGGDEVHMGLVDVSRAGPVTSLRLARFG